jgi:hypothetical protein
VTKPSIFVFIDADGRVTFRGRLDPHEIPDRVAAVLA